MSNQTPKRIAFIVDSEAPPESLICYVLTSVDGRRDWWHVWNPNGRSGRAQGSQIKYVRALYVLLSYAVCRAATVSATPKSLHSRHRPTEPIRIGRDDKIHWPWAYRVFNVLQRPREYKAIRHEFREGLAPLLRDASRGGKKNDPRIEIAAERRQSVFFWDATSPRLAFTDLDRHADGETSVFLRAKVPACLDIGVVHALSRRIPPLTRRETWQDLYRRSAIDWQYSASSAWIEATVKPVELSPMGGAMTTDIDTSYQQMASLNDNILLIGTSGSGKTAALRRLTNTLCIEEPYSREQRFPIYVKLKEYEPVMIRSLENHNAVDISELIGKAVSATIGRKSTAQELHDSSPVRDLVKKWCPTRSLGLLSREDILNALYEEARLWFENDGMLSPHVLLLLDGINELYPHLREALKNAVSLLLRPGCRCRLIVSCRSDLAGESLPEPRERLRVFQLLPPTEGDIILYLDQAMPGRGHELFSSRISADDKILSLAKNMFFLSRFVETLSEDPNARLSSVKASAVQRLVLACIHKKQRESAAPDDLKKRSLLFAVLPYVAKWTIETTVRPEGKTASPSVFSDSLVGSRFSATEAEEALEFAETCGLLTTSGLVIDQNSRFGAPVFIHEFVRDYFAAHYLLLQQRLAQIPHLQDVLEYLEWDGALEMYFGLLQDADHLREDLVTLAEWDVFLAARCLACCPVADEACAQQLLQTFSSPRFRRLYRDNEFPPASFNICTALSHVFSTANPETLRAMYLDTSTPNHVRDAIPAALVLALGQNAFPYLKHFIDHFDLLDCESAYMAVKKLGTPAAWELLTTKYIEYAQHPADNKHMVVQIGVFGRFRGVFPDLVLRQVAKVRHTMNPTDYGDIHIDSVVRSIACALLNVGPEYVNDLLKLEEHPDNAVAEQASAALLEMKHPKAIEAAFARIRHSDDLTYRLHRELSSDLIHLCKLRKSDIDETLWRLFEDSLTSDLSEDWSHVPYELALRTERHALERLIRRCLSLDSRNALESLKAFVRQVPDVVLPILLEQPGVRKGTSTWHRLIVFRAGCGDTSVKAELLNLLDDIEEIKWVTDTRDVLDEMRAPLANWIFQAFVIDVVGKLRIPEALPILRQIAEKKEPPLPSVTAHRVLVDELYHQVPTRRQATAIADSMVATCSRDETPTFGWYDLVRYVATWPSEMLLYFLHDLRDRVEVAIRRRRSPVVRLYTFIAQVRNDLQRRHLEFFKNWPCSPPVGSRTVSRPRGRKTKPRPSTRRKRS